MPVDLRSSIHTRLTALQSGDLSQKAVAFFDVLGYRSDKTSPIASQSSAELLDLYNLEGRFRPDLARVEEWKNTNILFQVTDAEVKDALSGQATLFESSPTAIDGAIVQSFLFFALDLEGRSESWARSHLAAIAREIGKLFLMPLVVLFRTGEGQGDARVCDTVSLAIIPHRVNKRDETRDVLEKVTLIKDIRLGEQGPGRTHPAHLAILTELTLSELRSKENVSNFVELQKAWRKILSISELNKRFYLELSRWFFWARTHVDCPAVKSEKDEQKRTNGRSVFTIRLITRVLFAYFIRERRFVPEEFFRPEAFAPLLNNAAPDQSTYYNAVLQNLFFATLGAERDTRGWCEDQLAFQGKSEAFNDGTLRRGKDLFSDAEGAEAWFSKVPFLNGGLFERLDETGKPARCYDGFSVKAAQRAVVPNFLFWGEKQDATEALRAAYGKPKAKYEKVAPLLDILGRFKFTVDENTPYDEEVALDPELLGKVFENLLASYNPETKETARKQTGSFYTPREIVDYMSQEALAAHFEAQLPAIDTLKIRALVASGGAAPEFSEAEIEALLGCLRRVTILDPACGSGAFPMGALHLLLRVLECLDPDGARWEAGLRAQIAQIELSEPREAADNRLNEAIALDGGNYVRKLSLIERTLFGVDVQPIAVQIAKLRFFIALVIEQNTDDPAKVQPLPNLETKIVAANTLLTFEMPAQKMMFGGDTYEKLVGQLSDVRRRHFRAQKWRDKKRLRQRDEDLRGRLKAVLKASKLEDKYAEKAADWNPYDQNGRADFFQSEWMFGPDLKAGFSIVIGNPPYVRADFGGDFAQTRKNITEEARYQTLYEKWDLFIPFIERSVQLLEPGGIATMIVSDAYCHAKYALKSQRWALENTKVRALDFLSDIQVFEAAVRNVIFFFQEANEAVAAENVPQRRLHLKDFGAITMLPSKPQNQLTPRAFFPEEGEKTEFDIPVVELEKICYISKGMACHAHEKNAPGEFVLDDLISIVRDKNHPRPFVEGKNLSRWLPTSHNWLEWGTKRAPALFSRPTFPQLYAVPEKLISMDISGGGQLRVIYDDHQLLHNHSAWSFVPWDSLKGVTNRSLQKVARYEGNTGAGELPKREELEKTSRRFAVKYLIAVMNSSFARDFLRRNRRSNIHLYPDDWKKLPVAVAASASQAAIEKVVDWILFEKKAGGTSPVAAVRGAFWEQLADALVSELYFPLEFQSAEKSVFAALEAAQIPSLAEMGATPTAQRAALEAHFMRVFDAEHPLRRELFFIEELPSVAQVSGKGIVA